ncbi:Glycosyltransferase [Quillaja saponaria]|uniref:Glycosyltransferase n=1 Tax=Quillaja saponaria TaxID=32244 RepID=A0AAD7Q013_QUISA|nr:Glycosyltransferase [Quillaja saponaria]
MGSQPNPLHFILFPLMAQGHMIPMVDIARLFAQRGVIVTIFTTPKNSARFENVLARAVLSGFSIQLVHVQFPFEEAGLPEGCENFDMLPSSDLVTNFFTAIKLMQKPAEELFETLTLKPNCIISDMCIPWTAQIAKKHHIPRIAFHGFSSFALLCIHNVYNSKVAENITSESEHFVVPDIPDHIEITKAQLPETLDPKLKDFTEQLMDADVNSYGAIINTFEELEQEYVKGYKKVKKDKVWCIGPVSLCNKNELDKTQRGNKASIDEHECLEWINLQQPNSVVYVCLGSLCNLIPLQLIELAVGLEASNRPFIWVIRENNKLEELENWIKENGFEDRMKGRGLLIRGWAPQVLILSHSSIGGFLTHCGWNSILEGVTAGVPMVTWPLFADQFLNEKLVAQVLKIGVRIGVDDPVIWGKEEKIGVYVQKNDIKEAIENLMDEGEESEERRKRVRELGKMAKKALEEGGSSHLNMTLVIQEIMQQTNSWNEHET